MTQSLVFPVWPSPVSPLAATGIYHGNDKGRDHGEDGQQSSQEVAWSPRNITSGALCSETDDSNYIPCGRVQIGESQDVHDDSGLQDPAVRAAQPKVDSGRKWKVAETVEEAVSRLRVKEGVGAVQQDRRGVGGKKVSWWSRGSEGGRRVMVSEELRSMEEEKRVARAVCQPQQGA